MVRSAGNLVKSFIVMITAFFELCLTGRAVYALKIAQSESRPGNHCILYNRASGICPHKPPKLALFVLAVFFVSAVMFAGYKIVRSRSVSPHQVVKEDVNVLENKTATRKATEGTSSLISRAEQIAIECCVIASIIMIVGGILINSKRKESLYGQEKGNYKTHQRNPFITL